MEESEQRRERLKAMRIEAAAAAIDANSESADFGVLSNPLVEGQNTSTPTHHFSPRFDYYTDPMAAFSGTRKKDNIVPHPSHNMLPRPTFQGMTPEPPYQTPGVNAPNHAIPQSPGAHFNQRPTWRPMEFATLSSTPQGSHPNTWGGPGRPFNNAYPFGRPQGNPPNDWGGRGGSFNYAPPPNMPRGRGGNFSRPSFRQEGSYYGQNQRYNSSPHHESGNRYPDSGRGRGFSPSNNRNSGSRMGGRRGGSHESVSAEVRPDLYYKKEMVEDPWKMLTPVIWKDTRAGDSDKSWLPKSIAMKKAKVSTEHPQPSISQQSLAEYLASSFNDEPVQK